MINLVDLQYTKMERLNGKKIYIRQNSTKKSLLIYYNYIKRRE
jgi:hypothetical protein